VKFFICSADSVHFAVPSEKTERIISLDRVQTGVCEKENNEAFISLRALFRFESPSAPHGLILKSGRPGPNGEPVKTIHLTPKIDIELEIPEENIYDLPKSFTGLFRFFSGLCFTEKQDNVILIIDIEKILEKFALSQNHKDTKFKVDFDNSASFSVPLCS
jgi:hypothetical protein